MFQKSASMKTTFAAFNSKEGAFVVTTKNPDGSKTKDSFNKLPNVLLTRAAIERDEYDGQPINKMRLTLTNPEKTERAIVDFNMGVYATAKLVQALTLVDLAKPITLGAFLRKAGSKGNEQLQSDMADLSVNQAGIGEHGYPTIDYAAIPKSVTATVGKKTVTDSSAREEWVEAQVTALAAKLGTPVGTNTPADETPPADAEMEIPF